MKWHLRLHSLHLSTVTPLHSILHHDHHLCPLHSLPHRRHPARVHVAHPLWLVFDRDDATMHFVSNATIDRTTTGQFV